MRTLADAWNWYEATAKNLVRMRRLGAKHWEDLSRTDVSIWHDDHFRMLEAPDIVAETSASLSPMADLAVVVLFSVFESRVRDYLVALIAPQAEGITDPILKEAADDAIQGVKEGSFYRRVLEPLKKQGRVPADLITQVDQVRDYRNWVAHGRRDAPANNVTPKWAYDRLSNLLAALGIAAEPEEEQSDRPAGPPE
jgi:hypothetical protein